MSKQITDLTSISAPALLDLFFIRDSSIGVDKKITYENLIAALMPAGIILPYGGDGLGSPPTGFLFCDGSAVSRTTYAILYAVIGDRWGEGDGSTTFHLPDGRGEHLRGVDHGQGNDPDAASRTASATGGATGDAVGTKQLDAMQGHRHEYEEPSIDAQTNPGGASKPNTIATADTGDPVTDGVNGAPRTASETRGRNIAVDYVIKT